MLYSRDQILSYLEEVKDPEVPVLSVVELGIIRDAIIDGENVRIDVTPTYSGCPAIKAIEDRIVNCLHAKGVPNVKINTVYSPAWTTDWISAAAREKLRKYGIAPPGEREEDELIPMPGKARHVACPFCRSQNTQLKSEFGSTACKSLHYCGACQQPFEHFKAF